MALLIKKKYSIKNFSNGKLDGIVKIYHKNGQLNFRGNYKDGEKHGLQETYYKNHLTSIENYKKDRAKRSQEINLETPKNNELSKPTLSGDLNSNILEN